MQHVLFLWGENKTTKYTTHTNLFANVEHQLLLKEVFFNFSFSSQVWIDGYRLYIRRKKCDQAKGLKKMISWIFLPFPFSPDQSCSEIIRGQWLSIDLPTTLVHILISNNLSSPEMGQQKRVWGQQQVSANPAVNSFLMKKEGTVQSKTNTFVFTTASFIPGISMQNYRESCLRNTCTCVAWAQFLCIIMLHCLEVILQMWGLREEHCN